MRGHESGNSRRLFENALPSANTEFGALILIGLTTRLRRDRAAHRHFLDLHALGAAARRPASCSETESRNSTILTFRLAHRSCVMQRPVSSRHAVFLAAALGGVDRLVDGDDDVGHGDLLGAAAERVAAARAARALDELVAAQLAEQLFEVRQRDLLALRDGRERDRPLLERRARSIIAVTAKRPLVVRRMGCSPGGVLGHRLRSGRGGDGGRRAVITLG